MVVYEVCCSSFQLGVSYNVEKYSGSSIKYSGSLWWTIMRPKFIVGDGKFCLRSGWICSSSSSVIKLSFVSSNNSSCSTSEYSMNYYYVSIIWVS